MSEVWSPFGGISKEAARALVLRRNRMCSQCDQEIHRGSLAVPHKPSRVGWTAGMPGVSRFDLKYRHLRCPEVAPLAVMGYDRSTTDQNPENLSS